MLLLAGLFKIFYIFLFNSVPARLKGLPRLRFSLKNGGGGFRRLMLFERFQGVDGERVF